MFEVHIWIHYLGKSLYNREDFTNEVNKYGVQRSIAYRILPNFSFGQPVLLAYYDPEHKLAEAIGYLTIEGLTHNLPKDLTEELGQELDIVDQEAKTEFINRRCGKYIIGLSMTVRDTLKEIIQKIREICERHNGNPEKFKYFLTGSLTPFPTPVLFNDIKFFRGYKKLEFELEKDRKDNITYPEFMKYVKGLVQLGKVEWVYDYDKRRYVTKKDQVDIEEQYAEKTFNEIGGL